MPTKTSSIAKYTGSRSQSRIANSPLTATLNKRIADTFQVNLSHIGNLNPQQVRNMSVSAQAAKEQVEMAKIYIQAAKDRGDSQLQIEQMISEYVKDSESALRKFDKLFQGAVVLNEKHRNHMNLIMAQTNGQVQMLRQEGQQALTEYERSIVDQLKSSQAIHQYRLKQGSSMAVAGTRHAITQLKDQPRLAEESRQERTSFFNFLKGKPKAKLPTSKRNYGGLFA